MRSFRTLCLVLILAASSLAWGQSVRWEVADQGSLSSTLQLVFENCAPEGQPDLPTVPGATFTYVGQSQSTNIVNFQVTRSVALTYMVRGRQNSPVQIPAFTVRTDKGSIRVPAFSTNAPSASVDAVATARLIPARTSVWAGEVFGLDYELTALRRNNPQISPTFDWTPAPLVAEDWSKPEVTEETVGGERRVKVVFQTRAYAKTPNTLKLEAASHLLSIQTGTIGFGIISQPRMEPVSVTSDQPVIEVRPLPAAPTGFTGAVGQFTLTSKVVPERATVGEPITWTLELSGTGNWPDIAGLPSRTVSSDFQVVQPKARQTPQEGKLFDVTLTEDVVLVPTKAGSYTLGPVTFTYFDPRTGTYQTLTTPRTTLDLGPAAAPLAGPATAPSSTPDARPAVKAAPPKQAPLPDVIPRDPLPGSAVAATPLSPGALIAGAVAPFLGVSCWWLWLALRRARTTDPLRPRREARDRLQRTLAELPAAGAAERGPLLHAWQRDAAVLFQVPSAAPTPQAFADGSWARLWNEADRALYAGEQTLPPDWVARAQEAAAAVRVPGFQPWRLFRPQNLMPFAAALVIGLAGATVVLAAAEPRDPLAAYRAGEFGAAEKAFRARLAQAPTDWIARHNLSLTLAQQERPAESAAQATAAFVQRPADPAVRWHFVHSLERSGLTSPIFARFASPGPLQTLARLLSPAAWQRTLLLAAMLVAVGLGLWLWSGFNAGRRRAHATGLLLAAAGLLLAGGATAGLVAYGKAGDAAAVIVARPGVLRSIPSEADATQKTTPLAPGTLALTDRDFLGGRWLRLVFENGQTGWVRKDDVVALWR